MTDKMYVVIVVRKEVPDRDAGRAVYDTIKQRLADRPDVQITGQITNHFTDEPNPG